MWFSRRPGELEKLREEVSALSMHLTDLQRSTFREGGDFYGGIAGLQKRVDDLEQAQERLWQAIREVDDDRRSEDERLNRKLGLSDDAHRNIWGDISYLKTQQEFLHEGLFETGAAVRDQGTRVKGMERALRKIRRVQKARS